MTSHNALTSSLTDAQRLELRRRVNEAVAHHQRRTRLIMLLASVTSSVILTGIGLGLGLSLPGTEQAVFGSQGGWMIVFFPAIAIVLNLMFQVIAYGSEAVNSERHLRAIYTDQVLDAMLGAGAQSDPSRADAASRLRADRASGAADESIETGLADRRRHVGQ